MVANSIQNLPAFVDSGQHSIVTAPANTGPSPRMRNLTLRGSGSTSFLPGPVVALSCNGLRTLIMVASHCAPKKYYWEIIADNLSKAGWIWGCVSAVDAHGRTIWIADAHRGDGKRFVAHAHEKLTAFIELEAAVEPFSAFSFL
jgi:hypothetical protein